MQACSKLICAKLGIDWTFAPWVMVKLFVLRKLPEVQRDFIHTQHLHVVASSIAKLHDDAFVSAATADMCFMVNLVRLFMKPHLLALLKDNCLDLLRCAFLRKLSGCMRNMVAFCQHLLRPIKSAILA